VSSGRGPAIRFELERAVVENELVLHFQPRLRLETMEPRGVEALVRWRHPTQGLVSPLEFLPAAEREGLIREIEAWVVREALLASTVWRRDGVMLGVSVNVSPRGLHDPQFLRLIERTLRIQRSPRAFIVELSAAGMAAERDQPRDALEQLRAAGVRASLDDVTSLEQLEAVRALRWDYVKLGRAVIGPALREREAAALARRLADAVSGWDIHLAAMGVEDEATLAFVRELGCDLAQGYFIAPPMPMKELVSWIRARG
jgi:EAL domain-containing protein (putative c-di-GMP-specific phosphodiesterase class I)